MKEKLRRITNSIFLVIFLAALIAAPVHASLLSYGMLPVYPRDIEEGEYEVEAECDSPYFKVQDAVLTVKDGEMTLRFVIPSLSYLYVYPGTAKEARYADESAWVPREEGEGESIFEIPVEALDQEVSCAAYSKARKKWYPRNIVVYASSLPSDALKISLPDYELIDSAVAYYEDAGLAGTEYESKNVRTEAQDDPEEAEEDFEAEQVDLEDGEYSIECNMTGGSGRASISSPTYAFVKEGKAYARLIWSSTYYDYMIVGGEKYLNETTDGGNSTFTIPITAFDEGMTVIADTTAMGDPVEIEYILTFYYDSFGEVGLVPQEAAKNVLIIGIIIIVIGGVINFLVKRKRH